MRRLSSLGSRSFRRGFGRYALTIVGIALGVALFFGVTVANTSVNRQLDEDAARFSGGVIIQSAGTYGGDVPAETVERVAQLPGVATVGGYLGFATQVPGETGPDARSMYVTGHVQRNGTAPPAPRPTMQDERLELDGRKPAADNEIVVGGRPLVDRTRLGNTITLATPTGPHVLTVTGIYRSSDGGANDNSWGEVTIEAARRLSGKPDVFTYVPVQLGKGVAAADWLAENSDTLGPDVAARRSGIGAEEYRELLQFTQATFSTLAAVAMAVGAFLVFLTLSTAVAERTRLYGTLRALGASRRQVLRVVLREALTLGVVATAAGLALGYATSRLFLRLAVDAYGVDNNPDVVIDAPAVLGAVAVGLVVTIASALVPARRAARLSPVEAIRGQTADEQRLSRSWIAGALLFALSLPLSIPRNTVLSIASALALLFGTVLLVPVVMSPLARVVGRATRRLAPSVGDVSVMHMVKERSRSAYTLALVLVVLCTLFGIGGVNLSFRAARDDTLDRQFPADIAVAAGQRIDAAFEDEVRGVPGVDRMTELRFGTSDVIGRGGARVELVIIDPHSFFAVQGIPWVDGDDDRAEAALARGNAVLVPQGLSRRFGAGLGERITMETAAGRQTFVVAGVYPTTETPKRVMVGLPDGRRYFNAGDANVLAVKVEAGSEPAAVAQAIRGRVQSRGAFVELTSDQKEEVRRESDRYFNLLYAVLGVAAAMGLLGLANTLAMSVLRRTREIGVLRALGTQRAQVRSLVLVESATMVAVAAVLAIPMGWLLSFALLGNTTDVLGIVVRYRQPWQMVPALSAVAAVVALLAALAPARRAARVEPTVALRFD